MHACQQARRGRRTRRRNGASRAGPVPRQLSGLMSSSRSILMALCGLMLTVLLLLLPKKARTWTPPAWVVVLAPPPP